MISLASIAQKYQQALLEKYGYKMQNTHRHALKQIIACHTAQAGAMLYHCDDCHLTATLFPSCGHRHCPACQHKANNDWLDKQRQKLLPVDYYLVGFTLPYQLRSFVWHHQKWAYQALLKAAKETLNSFFKKDKKLGDITGYIAVLHTHARNLDFHPHVHFVVPAGTLNKNKTMWLSKAGKYLFYADNLAKVFRGKFIEQMCKAHYYLPAKTPKEWNVDCEYVGKGDGALTYLARYLYRSVISENNILSIDNDQVIFRYKESKSKQYQNIKEPAVDFLWRVLQHVLPKGFRRARNYGFLHGNAKATLQRLQLILKVILKPTPIRRKNAVCCPQCKTEMQLYMMRIGSHLIKVGTTI
ncbi:IS91 family transposase [Psychromonas antarctica]|uniref:IS91 family transposase n=1 Tax=Psychromonas antarctica TaxID=67573 RepID=UPI001EE960EA|nr:transposase [Psychromonas antarctica]MCG6202614.1 transposase [Psychromonas antarctica]